MSMIYKLTQRIFTNSKDFIKGLISLTDIIIGSFIFGFILVHFGVHLLGAVFMLTLGLLYGIRAKMMVLKAKSKGFAIENALALQIRIAISILMVIVPCFMLSKLLFNLF
ncbi:MAG: hypothetical protein O2809_02050 [Proteobacteria bacterium]|nr:hypothetical protein [Pseudomonadota bacterium]